MASEIIFPKKSVLIVLFILISALAIRLYDLYKYDVWFDEIITLQFSHQKLDRDVAASGLSVPSTIFERVQRDPHPFFHYLLIYVSSFFLEAGKSLRLLSVIFSTLSLLIFYRLTRTIYRRSTSMLALLLMAVSPFQVWYAQEMRVYALSCFFSLVATFFLIKVAKKGGRANWVYFFIAQIFALLTNYYSFILLIIALGFLVLKHKSAHGKRILLFIAAMFVLGIPFLNLLSRHFFMVRNSFWLKPPVLKNLVLSFSVFGLGYSANYPQLIIGTILLVSLFVYGVYRSIRDKNEYAYFLLASFLLPIITIYVISQCNFPVYIDRQFIVITPFYYLFIAYGITGIRNVKFKLSLCVVLLALIGCVLGNYYNGFMLSTGNRNDFYAGVHEKKQSQPLLDYLYASLDKEDIVAATDIQSYVLAAAAAWKFGNLQSYWLLCYPKTFHPVERNFFKKEFNGILKTINAKHQEGYLHAVYYVHGRDLVMEKEPLANKTFNRIWLVTSFWDKGKFFPVNNNHEKIVEGLSHEYTRKEFKEKDGIVLELFVKR